MTIITCGQPHRTSSDSAVDHLAGCCLDGGARDASLLVGHSFTMPPRLCDLRSASSESPL